MFQTETEEIQLFDALRHLKYNKHAVVLFHLLDHNLEKDFRFENTPKRFVDVETGAHIDLYAENIQKGYSQKIREYQENIKLQCARYGIKYVDVDVQSNFAKVLNTFMTEQQKFA